MKCKFCKSKLYVNNTREYEGKLYRKRICPKCDGVYFTEEHECSRNLYLMATNYDKKMRDLAKLDKNIKM
jgi:transcriptional regulator NrdR family protein